MGHKQFKNFTTMIKGKISFGFNAVNAGQKTAGVSNEPLFVVAPNQGSFRLSPAVTAALGLCPGDYIQLNDNIQAIDEAIRNREANLVALCEENGLSLDNPDDVETVRAELREFSISKGVAILNADGTPKQSAVRTSKAEKQKFLDENLDAIFTENYDALVELATKQGVADPTEEYLKGLVTVDMIASKTEDAYTGSKLATTSDMTGIGLTLTFTDTNMWNVMKSDLDVETRSTIRRTFKVDLKNPAEAEVNNGKEKIKVPAYRLIDFTDVVATRTAAKAEAETEE